MLRHIVLIFIVLSACMSCKQKAGTQVNRYFSLDSFFAAESKHLTEAHLAIRKTIQQGDSIETYTDSFPDWNKELSVFRFMDINKAINRDAYDTDTILASSDYTHVLTEAKDYNKSIVRVLDVLYSPEGKIEMVTIQYHNTNAMHDADYSLNYLPGKGYNLSGSSKALAGSPHLFDIHAEIGRPGDL